MTAQTAVDTSQEAFDKIKPHTPTLRQRVLDSITNSGLNGRTPSELIAELNELDYSVRPRITELRKAGLVKDSGVVRFNDRGNNEKVFILGQETFPAKAVKLLTFAEIAKAIDSFIWEDTPQGQEFWSNVYDALSDLPEGTKRNQH